MVAMSFSTCLYECMHTRMCLHVCMYLCVYVFMCAPFTGVPKLLSLLRSSPGLCSDPVCDNKCLDRESTTCSKGLLRSPWLSQHFLY